MGGMNIFMILIGCFIGVYKSQNLLIVQFKYKQFILIFI